MDKPAQPQGNFVLNLNFRRNGNDKAPPITGRISTPEDPETEYSFSAFEHTDKTGQSYWIGPVDMNRSLRQALNSQPQDVTNTYAGQFFTPEPVVELMAAITMPDELPDTALVSDPACGSGRMLIAGIRRNRYATFLGTDTDLTCVHMTALTAHRRHPRHCRMGPGYSFDAGWHRHLDARLPDGRPGEGARPPVPGSHHAHRQRYPGPALRVGRG